MPVLQYCEYVNVFITVKTLVIESLLHNVTVSNKRHDIENDVVFGWALTMAESLSETAVIYQIQPTSYNASFALM